MALDHTVNKLAAGEIIRSKNILYQIQYIRMNSQEYTIGFIVDQAPQEVFDAINNVGRARLMGRR